MGDDAMRRGSVSSQHPKLLRACFDFMSLTWTSVRGTFRVTEYRAYIVGRDGHFVGFEPLVCADDAEAVEFAKRLLDDHMIELWCGERLVTKLERPDRK
jgi:hypothetical protein